MSKAIDLENGLPAIKTWVEGKFVEKENGKGLSTNDYTTTEKNKLAGIEAGAEVNVQADWNASSGDAAILNKPSIPTATTTTPKMNGTAAVGTETKWAKGDHVHPTDTTRAPLASPALTGTPTAPTAEEGTNTTQIATTAFVKTAVDNVTIDDFTGAYPGGAGTHGLVPAPPASSNAKYLNNFAQWVNPSADELLGEKNGSTDVLQNIIDDLVDNKVDKEAGKGLSTNDYTTAEKTKLSGISEGAQANVLEGVQVNGTDLTITSKKVNVPKATTNVFGAVRLSDDTDSTSDAATGGIAASSKAVHDARIAAVASANSHTDNLNKLITSDLESHAIIARHMTTVEGVSGLNLYYDDGSPDGTAVFFPDGDGFVTAFNTKVDKEAGKGLSTNDYTTTEKDKLSGIASGAQVNVIESVKVNGTALAVSSKAVNVPKATNSTYGAIILSDATDGTAAAASGGTAATPKAVADALSEAKTYSDGFTETDPTVPSWAKASSKPTYTAAEVHAIELHSLYKEGETIMALEITPNNVMLASNIELSTKAHVLTRAPIDHKATGTTYGAGSSGYYGHVKLSDSTTSTTGTSGGTAATPKAVSDALAAAKTYADGKVTGLYNYKGSVATYANLPASPSTGDVYNVEAAYQDYPAGTNWAWTGTAWDALGGSFTITFATAAEVTAVLEA